MFLRIEETSDPLEFPREQLFFLNDLGQGAFGKVKKATANGLPNKPGPTIVAVKEALRNGLFDEYLVTWQLEDGRLTLLNDLKVFLTGHDMLSKSLDFGSLILFINQFSSTLKPMSSCQIS